VDRDRNANLDRHIHEDCNSDPEQHSDPFRVRHQDPDSDSDCNPNLDADPDSHSDAHSHRDCNRDLYTVGYADSHSHVCPDPDPFSHSDASAFRSADIHTATDSHPAGARHAPYQLRGDEQDRIGLDTVLRHPLLGLPALALV
jgi:hypothetical protein